MTPPILPDPADLLHRARSELAAGAWAQAVLLTESLLADGDPCSDLLHIQALARWGQGDVASALPLLTRATILSPSSPDLFSDLGVLRYLNEDWAGAADAFAACLELHPGDTTALQGRAESLLRTGRCKDAEVASREWVAAAPASASAHRFLAECLAFQDLLDPALQAATTSLALNPASERTLLLLGAIYQRQRRYEPCLEYTQAAARLHPNSFRALARLAVASWEAGDLSCALTARARATELKSTDANLSAILDWLTLHDPSQTAKSRLEVHRRSAASACGNCSSLGAHSNTRDPDRCLRVGYLSGEFVSNAAYCFLPPWLRCHDPTQVETFYYMSRRTHDAHTAVYRQFADHWRDVWDLSDDSLADRIRGDAIDLLVDLSGHFEYNRLGVFGRRPAPVQVAYPNYPGTTGLDAIDYIFTDQWTTPEGCEAEYAERPYRLPSGYLAFQPPSSGPPPGPLPAQSSGRVTFGLFQRPGKLHAGVWDAIAQILSLAPDARLLVHYASAELDHEGTGQRARLIAPFEARGISPSRLVFRGTRATPEHLAAVAEADIALDTFPYNGQTTTCDCLWMGVPVVSIRGNSHVSRVTPALLERMGLGQLAASTVQGYVETAVALASDLNELARLRGCLPESMRSNSITDGLRLAREIEAGYREMWRRWCESAGL